jgi:hypothetical protein
MAYEKRYALTALDPLTQETRVLILAAASAFDAYHQAKEVLTNCTIIRITYA